MPRLPGYAGELRVEKSMSKEKLKTLAIAILCVVVALMLGVIKNLKTANDLHRYATANNCTWVWQGTAYGDDRDYICK